MDMKLLFIFGNAAVGKMTVGQELMKITGLRLFHNHMAIELTIEILGYYDACMVKRLRGIVFEEYLKSNNEGIIFTYLWAFDMQSDWDYITHLVRLYESQGAEIYCVELVTSREIRWKRNETENRLRNKASKRDLEFSRKTFYDIDKKHRAESFEGEIPFKNYIRIDNSNLEPEEAARMIKEKFLF